MAHQITSQQGDGSTQKIAADCLNWKVTEDDVTKSEATSTQKMEAVNQSSMAGTTQVLPKKVEAKKNKKNFPCLKTGIRRSGFSRQNDLDDVAEQLLPLLGPCLTEIVKCKVRNESSYTAHHKWMAVNILLTNTLSGYDSVRKMLPLPLSSTLLPLLEEQKIKPGLNEQNVSLLKLKVQPQNEQDKLIFLLVKEMPLQKGLSYCPRQKMIYGYVDNGSERTKKFVSSALCIMASGVKNQWQLPIGYYLTESAIQPENCMNIFKSAIGLLESQDFKVLGITCDQGSNFEEAFKSLECCSTKPTVEIEGKSYFVHIDPPNLLKSSKNFLFASDVLVPGFEDAASWKHIVAVFETEKVLNVKLASRLSEMHVYDSNPEPKMEVKVAAQVLSHSTAVALRNRLGQTVDKVSVEATSWYCKKMNDIFDVLNSRAFKSSILLKKPFGKNPEQAKFLRESVLWLKQLRDLNVEKQCGFIDGWIQSINVVLQLWARMTVFNLPHLATRHICLDGVEHLFEKIHRMHKFPDAKNFAASYAKAAVASFV